MRRLMGLPGNGVGPGIGSASGRQVPTEQSAARRSWRAYAFDRYGGFGFEYTQVFPSNSLVLDRWWMVAATPAVGTVHPGRESAAARLPARYGRLAGDAVPPVHGRFVLGRRGRGRKPCQPGLGRNERFRPARSTGRARRGAALLARPAVRELWLGLRRQPLRQHRLRCRLQGLLLGQLSRSISAAFVGPASVHPGSPVRAAFSAPRLASVLSICDPRGKLDERADSVRCPGTAIQDVVVRVVAGGDRNVCKRSSSASWRRLVTLLPESRSCWVCSGRGRSPGRRRHPLHELLSRQRLFRRPGMVWHQLRLRQLRIPADLFGLLGFSGSVLRRQLPALWPDAGSVRRRPLAARAMSPLGMCTALRTIPRPGSPTGHSR